MSHRYKLRQSVRLTRPGFSDGKTATRGIYEVVRLMPADQTGEVSYRIREAGSVAERAVRESEIAAVGS